MIIIFMFTMIVLRFCIFVESMLGLDLWTMDSSSDKHFLHQGKGHTRRIYSYCRHTVKKGDRC